VGKLGAESVEGRTAVANIVGIETHDAKCSVDFMRIKAEAVSERNREAVCFGDDTAGEVQDSIVGTVGPGAELCEYFPAGAEVGAGVSKGVEHPCDVGIELKGRH